MKIKDRIIYGLALLLAFAGGVLAIADQVSALPLPPEWTKYWGLFVAAATGLRPLILLIGDVLDDGVVNQSFKSAIILALIAAALLVGLSACG